MAEKKKVLMIAQEMEPYTEGNLISQIAGALPLYANDKNIELRILMPRFGCVNERRHRLHEVVRLSGMNIIIANDDYPLIIKVASLPNARLQVYFLDNDEFFKRKNTFEDDNGIFYEDNADRMAFFCKGALETVKKFGWAPDIVHCHGWMSSLIPIYLKKAYKSEALFHHAKVIYSHYGNQPPIVADANFFAKASINNITAKDLAPYNDNGQIDLARGAAHIADAFIAAGNDLRFEGVDKPYLQHDEAHEGYLQEYIDFYEKLYAQ